jgi:hypothetical protein
MTAKIVFTEKIYQGEGDCSWGGNNTLYSLPRLFKKESLIYTHPEDKYNPLFEEPISSKHEIHMHDHMGLLCRHLKVTSPAENDRDSPHQKNIEDTKVWSSCSGYHADTSNDNFQQGNIK